MSYCSRFQQCQFTVLDLKSYGHFLLLMNFQCKFRPDPDFLIKCEISAKFSIDFFCILYAEDPPYFYFRFVWLTDQESIPHASTHAAIISAKFEVDMTIYC